jgi:hypothetical protein
MSPVPPLPPWLGSRGRVWKETKTKKNMYLLDKPTDEWVPKRRKSINLLYFRESDMGLHSNPSNFSCEERSLYHYKGWDHQ